MSGLVNLFTFRSKNTFNVNPLLNSLGVLFISSTLGGGGGGLFNLAKMIVSTTEI